LRPRYYWICKDCGHNEQFARPLHGDAPPSASEERECANCRKRTIQESSGRYLPRRA
jgi:hypothetical protein